MVLTTCYGNNGEHMSTCYGNDGGQTGEQAGEGEQKAGVATPGAAQCQAQQYQGPLQDGLHIQWILIF